MKNYDIETNIPVASIPDDTLGACLVKSCDSCEVISERIPEIKEEYDFWRRFW